MRAYVLSQGIRVQTGASQGIGRAIAIELAAVGADVVLCSRRPARGDRLGSDLRGVGSSKFHHRGNAVCQWRPQNQQPRGLTPESVPA